MCEVVCAGLCAVGSLCEVVFVCVLCSLCDVVRAG